MSESASELPHRRCNPLTGRWVLVSPHRTLRPWQGKREATATEQRPAYDPQCYLCPGNVRAVGAVNPAYASTYVFTNDYPALLPDGPAGRGRGRSAAATASRARHLSRRLFFSAA